MIGTSRAFHTVVLPKKSLILFRTSAELSLKYMSTKTIETRLFQEEVNIIYDSKCNVCKMEIDFLANKDKKNNGMTHKLKMTDLETEYNPNDPGNAGITYQDGMAAIHAVTPDGKILKGVPVFAAAYEQVGLGWLFKVTTWPFLKDIINFGYRIFAKYRTNITRGASLHTLIQEYESKKSIDDSDCHSCDSKSL
mmetsp:Transcript_462/g.647  ORF Transcript_462/g.647 Transcript_462/m.647 type:complete len:194 (+) Transcript_462:159-740(+)